MSDDNCEFLVVVGVEAAHHISQQEAFEAARDAVTQYIADHLHHKLPVKVTPELARWIDVRVYRLDSTSEVALPLQEWVDANYLDNVAYRKKSEADEYARFLELRAKYEEKFQRETYPGVPTGSLGF